MLEAGVTHDLVWDFAREPGLGAQFVDDVTVLARIGGGVTQTTVIGLGNDVPEILGIRTPLQEITGVVPVDFTVRDTSGDAVGVEVEFFDEADPNTGWRVARPGGVIAVYVWDYAEGTQMLRAFWDAAVDLDPAAKLLDEGERFPICHRDALQSCLHSAGVEAIHTRAIEVPTVFHDFEDYWTPFLGGQGPAPTYLASLSESRRDNLRERVRGALPTQADGSIRLTARAWAVRGVR